MRGYTVSIKILNKENKIIEFCEFHHDVPERSPCFKCKEEKEIETRAKYLSEGYIKGVSMCIDTLKKELEKTNTDSLTKIIVEQIKKRRQVKK